MLRLQLDTFVRLFTVHAESLFEVNFFRINFVKNNFFLIFVIRAERVIENEYFEKKKKRLLYQRWAKVAHILFKLSNHQNYPLISLLCHQFGITKKPIFSIF